METKTITGACAYKGITAQQHENFESVFRNFLSILKPKRILEIGTGSGGFTLFVRDVLNELSLEETKIKSYDIHPSFIKDSLNSMNNIEVVNINLFSSDNNYTLERNDIIVPYIQEEGITLVLCDGGNKVREFNQISDLLKVGDVIMCHDYCDTVDNFNTKIKDKIWLWQEVRDIDIEDSIKRNNLSPYFKEEFDNIVWGCFIKNE